MTSLSTEDTWFFLLSFLLTIPSFDLSVKDQTCENILYHSIVLLLFLFFLLFLQQQSYRKETKK